MRPGTTEKGYGNLNSHDIFAKEVYGVALAPTETSSGKIVQTDKSTGEIIQLNKTATWGIKLRSWIQQIGAEENDIERIPSKLRTNQHPRDLFTLFMSANVGTATLAFGTLGPGLFYLGWWDSFCSLLFFNLIGSAPPALIATLGPKLGPSYHDDPPVLLWMVAC